MKDRIEGQIAVLQWVVVLVVGVIVVAIVLGLNLIPRLNNLVKTSKIDFLGPLVLIIVILYGLLMVLLAWRQEPEPEASRPTVTTTASPSV